MAHRTQIFILADRLLQGRLAEQLALWRAAGVSTRAMAALLEQDLGIRLTHETIRRWLQSIPLVNGDPVEAA